MEKEKNETSVAIIIPQVVVHGMDPHTGIPFMPHTAAYSAAILKKDGISTQILDSFGIDCSKREVLGKFMLMGISSSEIAKRLMKTIKTCVIYCRTVAEFIAIEKLLLEIKNLNRGIRTCLIENAQAVTAFSLRSIAGELHKKGADIIIFGEPENRISEVVYRILNEKRIVDIPDVSEKGNDNFIMQSEKGAESINPDMLPFPSWEDFQLSGYWDSGFAHGPCSSKRFLPILTSRGCPFKCKFCIAPRMNPKWRGRSPSNVVEEMKYFSEKLGVREFHISDLNPTVNKDRIINISKIIIRDGLDFSWKLAQGTKIETIDEETVRIMAKAGCRYISFSPETGSPELLKKIGKRFDYEYAIRILNVMSNEKIYTQACFIAGLPGESSEDRKKSIKYMERLVDNGLDEIAVFGFAPIPGAELEGSISDFENYSQCTFNPSWRKDAKEVLAYRRRLYVRFFLRKLRFPDKIIRETYGFFSKKFETKMEMALYKIIKLYILRFAPGLFNYY